jgi:hypothetical protein
MAVTGRTGIAVAEIEIANEGVALLVEGKREAHSVGIVRSAYEARVAGKFQVFGVVAVGLAGHG